MTVRAEGQEMPGWVSVNATMTDAEIENAVSSIQSPLLERMLSAGWGHVVYLELDLIQRLVPRSGRRENTVFVVLMDRGPGWDRIIVHDTLGNWVVRVVTMDPARIGEISSAVRRELAFHLRQLRDERRRELGVEM